MTRLFIEALAATSAPLFEADLPRRLSRRDECHASSTECAAFALSPAPREMISRRLHASAPISASGAIMPSA